jgi:pantoate--beta-alanine ligase
MYPNGTTNLAKYDLGFLETVLEGKYRPGHFQGVCQVMDRLLTMVQPHQLFMGQKDYQQCMVVARLLQLMQSTATLIPFPTIREADGLAMSSRNLRLPLPDRQKATTIYKCLQLIREQCQAGKDWKDTQQLAIDMLTAKGFRIDYVELADATTLEPLTNYQKERPAVALIAAFLGEVRLIDNMLI